MRKQIVTTLAALAIAAAGCTSSTADDPSAAAASASPSGPAVARTVTADDATETTDAYFAAYDDGDVEGMLDLLAPDAEVGFPGEPLPVEAWRLIHEYKVAEGTQMLTRDCTTEEVDDRDAVAVDCDYAQHEYVSRAVDGPVVPTTMTVVVGPDGIELLEQEFGGPDFTVYYGPFLAWVEAHHPEDADDVAFVQESAEDARRAGALAAQYADEWAAWLADNPTCTWRDTACQSDGAPEPADTATG